MKKIKISLRFPSNAVTQPITYRLIKDFDLEVSILHADISLNKMGTLVLDVRGEDENIVNALKFLEENEINYKLFNRNIIWKEDSCVHCGACTAVCPSGALRMDPSDWSLTFEREKCLVCELCVKTCPLKVMCVSF